MPWHTAISTGFGRILYKCHRDVLVKNRKSSLFVIPAKAGIHCQVFMDPRSPIGVEDKLCGGDGLREIQEKNDLWKMAHGASP